MARHYVDITEVSDVDLEFLGYYMIETDGEFALYNNKGELFIVHQRGTRRFIFVEDVNDAEILRNFARRPVPPP
jgi:hypothetical protein